ncbi:MAG: transcriptional regulator GcvA [Pseudomonadota bacterium]
MRSRVPSLNALRTFEAAARNGSFKAAAGELCVSHSAVSHQIKLLERDLGIELFLRKSGSVELTRLGRTYYPILRDAFDRIAEGTELLVNSKVHSTLTLQVYSTFAIRWLIPRISDLNEKHPELKLRLHTSQSDVDFEHEDVDLCVMIGHRSRPSLRYNYLFSSCIFPVCSEAVLESFALADDPRNLANAPLLQVYPSRRDWWIWLEENGIEGVDPDAGQQFDSYDLAMNAAMQGIGVALAMEPFVNRDLKANLLQEPYPQMRVYTPNDWYLVCRDEKSDHPDVVLFRRWLVDQVASDASIHIRQHRGAQLT